MDARLLQIDIEVNGQLKTFEDLAITAYGTKYANPIQNEAEVTIYNLDTETQNYILSETSPFNLNRTIKNLFIYAGRESYGTTKVYEGTIITSYPTQPPDIGVTLRALTGNFFNSLIVSNNYPGKVSLKLIAQQVAQMLELSLNFQTLDQNVANWSYVGSALKQIEALSKIKGINAFADDAALILKTINAPLNGITTILDLEHGMIGIPQITEQGIRVKFLFDGKTKLGGALQITSKIYPQVNGTYQIYKLHFQLANRDTPFYLIAEARRLF